MYAADRPPDGQGPHQSPTQPPRPYEPLVRRDSTTQNVGAYQHAPPTSPTASRLHQPSPSPRDRSVSSYYDPTTEGRAHMTAPISYQARSPTQTRAYEPASTYVNGHAAPNVPYPPASYSAQALLPPPPPPPPPPSASATAAPLISARPSAVPLYEPRRSNGLSAHTEITSRALQPPPQPIPQAPPAEPAARASNPMSMMNILSDEPQKAARAQSPPATPQKAITGKPTRTDLPQEEETRRSDREPLPLATMQPTAVPARVPLPPPTGPPGLTWQETEQAYAEILSLDISDIEADAREFTKEKEAYLMLGKKRTLELSVSENRRRKRRRIHLMQKWHDQFAAAAEAEHAAFIEAHEQEVEQEVRSKEIEEDKERKKDQQRKRRREKAIADEKIKRQEALDSLADVQDENERIRIEKDIERASKKIRDTESRLQGIIPSKERNESPLNPAKREKEVMMDGGLMTSFHTSRAGEEGTPDPAAGAKAKGRGARGTGSSARARKSKEKKQAEKEAAARGQAYLDQGQDLPPLAPKEEERLRAYGRGTELDESDDDDYDMTPGADVKSTAGLTGMAKYDSKGYIQIYEQITKDIARAVPKVVRIKNSSLDTKQSNARKTAQLAAKEARRWQLRTNKSTKDVAARAKRAMREMLGFWKRNERDEREGRKAAERAALDQARQAEAEREASRQKRKLNFLISQTELYSHFIGKKVKTDEIEKQGNGPAIAVSTEKVQDTNAEHTVSLSETTGKVGSKVTNFEDLDFDDEDALREAAMANAQNAVNEAQAKARAFNNTDHEGNSLENAQQDFDEGEMNFQNPTSLQSMDVPQPKMLTCQLKEYQLKGLNWLVNLYEQGINGILADEMGLGKTVQSISVMAYLAEVHDIWGPFLVIAPASTLHNWQQEITKFVPTVKVLPYWGNAKDRKVLRKFWDRKHITYTRDSPFHVLVTSYQLVVQDTAYFQKVKWQYMILDEAQAIKSSSSSRWKALLGFHCRNRLLLTGTPIQNNMQELWALLHFIMPSLFDSHDEFSEWFSKDIENHAQSNSKLNEDQLRRLHMILKPFMLRRVKKNVQKELGDKIELDVYCDLTYRQRAMYTMLRNKISILDLIEKAAIGDDQDTATLMNLVMQFRKVCNHPDLFERADTWSPLSISNFAETASFMREGFNINVSYSVRNAIDFWVPKMLGEDAGNLSSTGPQNQRAGWLQHAIKTDLSVWNENHIRASEQHQQTFSWLRFVNQSASEVAATAQSGLVERSIELARQSRERPEVVRDGDVSVPVHSMLNIVRPARRPLARVDGNLAGLMNIAADKSSRIGYDVIESCYFPKATAPPVELVCSSDRLISATEDAMFNVPVRRALYPVSLNTEAALLHSKLPLSKYPVTNMLPAPGSQKQRFTKIQVPSMRRFVTDSGKLACLDRLLRELKEGGHRVLLYFQMTRMIDLMEEYLTYRNYKYCRLDGSTKLEDRRDTVAAFQSSPEIFVFLLSTRAGGLGINLTSADTVIFYDSDWNPTIDSQAMDRAHRLGQTRQVTVYRLITRGTIEERIRKRALQKEEVQRVVISGQAGGDKIVDFNNRGTRENNRTKEMAMWLADDDEAAAIEKREQEVLEQEAKDGGKKKRKAPTGKRNQPSMDDMYHEGEGKFDDGHSAEASGAATPMSNDGPPLKKRKGISKKAKTTKQRLAVVDGEM